MFTLAVKEHVFQCHKMTQKLAVLRRISLAIMLETIPDPFLSLHQIVVEFVTFCD